MPECLALLYCCSSLFMCKVLACARADFSYINDLRQADNRATALRVQKKFKSECAMSLKITGHIFDTGLINKVDSGVLCVWGRGRLSLGLLSVVMCLPSPALVAVFRFSTTLRRRQAPAS